MKQAAVHFRNGAETPARMCAVNETSRGGAPVAVEKVQCDDATLAQVRARYEADVKLVARLACRREGIEFRS